METVAKDRAILKNTMESHLRKFFKWERITWDCNLKKITLKFRWDKPPKLDKELFDEIGMPILINFGHEDDLGSGVWIEVYPFGLEDGE
jgi:hypothetical protein